jgi:dihydroflavonol-4-reductase
MSRVLVTGATGFLGTHLVAQLLTEGHEVVALVRGAVSEFDVSGAAIARGDVLDAASVEHAARGCEAIFHCAGLVSRDPDDAARLQLVHVEGTKRTLDAARRAGVTRAIVASTSGVVAVSDEPTPIDESGPDPLSIIGAWPYYRSKLFAERAAFDRNDDGFEVVCVNPTLLLGPGDDRGSSTGDVLEIVEGRLVAIPSGGLSFVDARDAADAMVRAWKAGRPGERYLVAAQNLTMRAFCERIARLSGAKLPALTMPRSRLFASLGARAANAVMKHLESKQRVDRVSAEMAQYFWYVDATKAREELGWTPRDPMDTLADTIDDLRDRGAIWPDELQPSIL